MHGISNHPQHPTKTATRQTITLASAFKKAFNISGKDAKTVSSNDQLQALVLWERITNSAQKGPIETYQDMTISLQKVPQIPCINAHHDLTDTLKDGLSGHPKIKARLERSIAQWKNVPITIVSQKRPGLIERTDKKESIPVTRNIVIQKQAAASLGKKYDNKETLFDPTRNQAIESDYADIDHMDPWSRIVERIQTCTDFINTFPSQKVKAMLQNTLKKQYPDFFISSGTEIHPTQYLAACLYNHTDNLLGINHPDNTKKNDKEAIPWLAKHPEFGTAFVSEISATPLTQNQVSNPPPTLESLTNQSGFILKLNDSAEIKPEYRCRGLAYAAGMFKKKQTMGGAASIETQQLQNHMKSVALIKATGRVMGLLALTHAPESDTQSLRTAIEKFNTRTSKSRKRAANLLREDVHAHPLAHALAGKEHQASSSDSDDSIEVKLKRTQAELDTERLSRIQADQARIQADQARIQERDARIQADQARIQAEQDRAALIQEMRNDGVPETTIERVLKKAKIQHTETPHG